MAVSQTHYRSISLPSRLNPINSTEFEADLQKLKAVPINIISSEAIQTGLLGLAQLYNSVQQLTQSPSMILQQHQDGKSMEDQLEVSVELLDSCNTIRELVQMIKENVQALQSAFRRKGLDSGIQSDVATYVCFRKKMNKFISKTLKTLKNLEHKYIGSNENDNFIRVLREVSGITIAIFKGILGFLSCPTTKKTGGWNLVSKVMVTKSMAYGKDHSFISEMGGVDFALNTLQGRIKNSNCSVLDLQMVQKELQNLDDCIRGFEGVLEILFRQLVQSRVTLLNILTGH
ncbi:hypothetical protein BUALT_Bualt08G0096600 [Buddleja alternifolia]|uniref:Uncharacterized protein n=1 Tax=Buddleja alternifolia TaxID=168488 RepID=A0AAV6XG16_9LAMI|nr:hypothetical protein BUALT_Bualt08G0096600 [Buddleja alternifolia]